MVLESRLEGNLHGSNGTPGDDVEAAASLSAWRASGSLADEYSRTALFGRIRLGNMVVEGEIFLIGEGP